MSNPLYSAPGSEHVKSLISNPDKKLLFSYLKTRLDWNNKYPMYSYRLSTTSLFEDLTVYVKEIELNERLITQSIEILKEDFEEYIINGCIYLLIDLVRGYKIYKNWPKKDLKELYNQLASLKLEKYDSLHLVLAEIDSNHPLPKPKNTNQASEEELKQIEERLIKAGQIKRVQDNN